MGPTFIQPVRTKGSCIQLSAFLPLRKWQPRRAVASGLAVNFPQYATVSLTCSATSGSSFRCDVILSSVPGLGGFGSVRAAKARGDCRSRVLIAVCEPAVSDQFSGARFQELERIVKFSELMPESLSRINRTAPASETLNGWPKNIRAFRADARSHAFVADDRPLILVNAVTLWCRHHRGWLRNFP